MAFQKAGALWLKDGQNGKYMSGVVEINGEKHSITVFKNNYKQEAKHPDYVINMRVDDNGSQPAQSAQPSPQPGPPQESWAGDDAPF